MEVITRICNFNTLEILKNQFLGFSHLLCRYFDLLSSRNYGLLFGLIFVQLLNFLKWETEPSQVCEVNEGVTNVATVE